MTEGLNPESMENKESSRKKLHFVLVHGGGHGAWCWYKLVVLLENAGHSVTAMDLAGCGIDPKQLDEVLSLDDYVRPLMEVMESIPQGEKVVLVGHSMGGLALVLAMEAYSEKIAVAVFIAAVVLKPDITLHEYFTESSKGKFSFDSLMDTKFSYDNGRDNPPTSVILGPQMLASRVYQKCPIEDWRLATMLLRDTRIFNKENTEDTQFTMERYGSMPRVFVICEEDKLADKDNQRAMIEKAGVTEVEVIQGSDHNYLSEVAEKYG